MNYVDPKQLKRLHQVILERLLIPNIPPTVSNKDTFTQRHWSVLNADAHYIALYLLSNTDFTEVVRCKDCKCYIPDSELDHNEYPNPLEADGLCENIDKYTDETDFCSFGERKEDK